MQAQHGILTTLRRSVPALSATVAAHLDKSRSAFGRLVCEQFGFFDAHGHELQTSCVKAFRVLAADGHITLPPA